MVPSLKGVIPLHTKNLQRILVDPPPRAFTFNQTSTRYRGNRHRSNSQELQQREAQPTRVKR